MGRFRTMTFNKHVWLESKINKEKLSFKNELDALPVKSRLHYILKATSSLADSMDSAAQLRRFIYSIAALIHHERYGGLSTSQVLGLAQVAQTILQTNNINPVTSKLCFLYGEIHLALSQIFRKEGKHFESSWEQILSEHLSRKAPIGGQTFSSFSKALRFIRLGDAYSAIREFELAEKTDSNAQFFEKSRLGRIRSLRLAGRSHEAIELISDTRSLFKESTPEMQELNWEMICTEFQKTGNPAPFFAATKPNGTHYQAVYVIEAFFFAYSIASRTWEKSQSKISSLIKNKTLKVSKLGYFLHCAMDLEKCYDADIPLIARLDVASKCLMKRHRLLAIDRELLLLAAMTRWLIRSKADDLAEVTFNSYRALCLRLSSGNSEDVLGVLENIVTKFN